MAAGANVLACGGSSSTSTSSTTSTSTTATGTGGSGGSTSSAGGGGAGGSTTTTTTTGSGGSGGSNPCPGLGDACSNCASEKCMAVYCSCYADPQCGGLVQCNTSCQPGDQNCAQNCLNANKNGISEAFLLSDCAASQCAASCPGTSVLDDCQRCLFTSCASQMNNCLSDTDCSELIQCVQQCSPGDSGCQQDCGFQHLGSVDKAMAIQNCSQSQCAGKCM
ncbi:MAG: hypothetical protein U0359_22340 [Byssovorax sp.]